MKAVVLVGGEGTRLRPLTETIPKPLVPLMDRPSLDHVLDHLARHGVHEVVLSSPYLEDMFEPFIRSRHGDPAITWITETAPLGTGGAIVNALASLGDEPFFALNGDILTDLDLTAMLAFHRERGADATIALHHVEDARAFGLVLTAADGRVEEFREKPELAIPGDINAGTYLLDPVILEGWTAGEHVSIEREVFPVVIAAGHSVFGFLSDPYWLDLGTPAQYLEAHFDLFEGKVRGVSYPAPWIDPTADVDVRAHLGRWVAVGPGAVIAAGAQVDDSVIHRDAVVEARGAHRGVGPRPGVPGGIGGHPDGMRSGGRVPGSRRRGPGRGTGAGRHRGGRGVASPVRPDPCVTVRLPTGNPSMRRIRSLALVVAVSAALVPAPAARADGPITFYGSGWGHGLGLSQWGAYGLATEGWSATKILTHFYSGTKVTKSDRSPR